MVIAPMVIPQRVSSRPVGFDFLVVLLACFLFTGNASAEQHYRIILLTPAAKELTVGKLTVTAMAADNGFKVELDAAAFSDHFLSMRPFKCLADAENMQCYLPYTYPNRRRITQSDLTDLEYDLLFIERSPREYGIDPWNGRYYRLRWQGSDIVGEIMEVDLNILTAPPEDGNLRPVTSEDLNETELENQWLPRIRIELVE